MWVRLTGHIVPLKKWHLPWSVVLNLYWLDQNDHLNILLETQVLRPHPRPTESDILEMGPRNLFQQALQVIFIHVKAWESQFLMILLWPMFLTWVPQAHKVYLRVNSEMMTHGNKSHKELTKKNLFKWFRIKTRNVQAN